MEMYGLWNTASNNLSPPFPTVISSTVLTPPPLSNVPRFHTHPAHTAPSIGSLEFMNLTGLSEVGQMTGLLPPTVQQALREEVERRAS